MLTTYEVRWFYSGNIPENIQSWFKHCLLSPTKLPEKREDVYLYTSCDYLGIKLRQGALEIKWRYSDSKVMNFGSMVEGNVEKWKKCRFDSTGEAFQVAQIGDSPIWVRVAKVRYSQLYQVVANTVQPVSNDTDLNVDNGCSLELTNIEINGNKWWSIALEAFGEDSNLKDNLQVTAATVFRNYDNFPLQAKSSYGYPSLLELAL